MLTSKALPDRHREAAPFAALVDRICRRQPLQRKALEPFLAACDQQYWKRADRYVGRFLRYLGDTGCDHESVAETYLDLCHDMLVETLHFRRTGSYTCRCQKEVLDDFYLDASAMRARLIGLAVSQFLWKNHYRIFDFFLESLQRRRNRVRRYLEIGPGHGLYLAAAAEALPSGMLTGLDISPVSLRICREVLPYLLDTPHRGMHLVQQDVGELGDTEQFDFVTMGEVLEHVDDPLALLRKIAAVLSPDGVAFVTTCANCPSRDHVYLFRNADEIRGMLRAGGLCVEHELALRLDSAGPPRQDDLINYAALVRRSDAMAGADPGRS